MVMRSMIGVIADAQQSGAAGPFSGHATLTNNILAYWSFDDADLTGSDPDDKTGNGYDGTTSGATTGVSGAINEAFDFDGDNDQVAVANTPLSGLSEFTMMFLVKPEAGSDTRWIYFQDPNTCYLYLGGSGKWTSRIGNQIGIESTPTYSNGSFYQVVVTYDSTEAVDTDAFQISVNGSLIAAPIFVGGGTRPSAGTGAEHFGNASSSFDGLIDDSALWSRKLTTQEITDLWNGGSYLPY